MQERAQANLRRATGRARPALAAHANGEAGSDPFAMAALLHGKLAQLPHTPAHYAAIPSRPPVTATLIEPLSDRELEIVRLMASGMTNQQIADRLHVVVGTVKVHNHHIFGKLGVSNRVQALARARELNLLA